MPSKHYSGRYKEVWQGDKEFKYFTRQTLEQVSLLTGKNKGTIDKMIKSKFPHKKLTFAGMPATEKRGYVEALQLEIYEVKIKEV